MVNQFHMDPAQVRNLVGRLSALADTAHRDLSQLRATLDRAGACWGDDEPGRTIGDTYLPEATKAMTGLRAVADNIRALGGGISGFGGIMQQQDLEAGRYLQYAGRSDVPLANAGAPQYGPPLYAGAPPSVIPVAGTTSAQASGGAEPGMVGAQADPTASRSEGNSATHHRPQADGRSTTTPGPISSTAGNPAISVPDSQRGENNPSQQSTNNPPDVPRVTPSGVVAGQGTAAARVPTDPGPQGSSQVQLEKAGSFTAPAQPQAGKADTPWSRPTGTAGTDTGAPRSMPRGQFPAGVTPNIGAPSMALPPRRAKPRRYQPVSDHGAESPSATHLRELADRHGLRLIGFEDSALDGTTLVELAAAVDNMLGKYPFLELGGLEITDISDTVSRVALYRADGSGPAWITLDRACMVDREQLEHRVAGMRRPGRRITEIFERPMYSTIVADFGRIMAHAAGPGVIRKARRGLIAAAHCGAEHRRTLAEVVAHYRSWLNPLWDSNSDGPFDPGLALIAAFSEVELCDREASMPARVLHRLLVDSAVARR